MGICHGKEVNNGQAANPQPNIEPKQLPIVNPPLIQPQKQLDPVNIHHKKDNAIDYKDDGDDQSDGNKIGSTLKQVIVQVDEAKEPERYELKAPVIPEFISTKPVETPF